MKPENICVGLQENFYIINLIDFGLSTSFIENSEHVELRFCKSVGNLPFKSPYACLNNITSRRDDLFGILYMLSYFYTSKLPFPMYEDPNAITMVKCKMKPSQICVKT